MDRRSGWLSVCGVHWACSPSGKQCHRLEVNSRNRRLSVTLFLAGNKSSMLIAHVREKSFICEFSIVFCFCFVFVVARRICCGKCQFF